VPPIDINSLAEKLLSPGLLDGQPNLKTCPATFAVAAADTAIVAKRNLLYQ
jgi:hypothetical protein